MPDKNKKYKQNSLKLNKNTKVSHEKEIQHVKENNVVEVCNNMDQADNHKVNAFDVMMSSRTKSLGRNLTGKDLILEDKTTEDVFNERKNKIKRKEILQKMAEAKGSLKNKEIEKHKEAYVKRKMEKRAENLKRLLNNKNSNCNNNSSKDLSGEYLYEECEVPKKIKRRRTSSKSSISTRKKIKTDLSKNIVLNDIDVKPLIATEQNTYNHDLQIKSMPSILRREQKSQNADLNKSAHKKDTKAEIHTENDDNESDQCTSTKLIKEMATKTDKSGKLSLCEQLSSGDEEFISKLSPSIRKKENMLTYFKPINKTPNRSTVNIFCKLENDINRKLSYTNSKKNRKLKKTILEEESSDENISDSSKNCISFNSHKNVKHTIDKNTFGLNIGALSNSDSMAENEVKNMRPKRTKRKPMKYDDSVEILSDDSLNNLQIYTPKKRKSKRHLEISDSIKNMYLNKTNCSKLGNRTQETNSNEIEKPKTIAPIFCKKSQIKATTEVRHGLHSGNQDQLNNKETVATGIVKQFNTVVHIQQREVSSSLLVYSLNKIKLRIIGLDKEPLPFVTNDISSLINLKTATQKKNEKVTRLKGKCHTILQGIKRVYPKFPVFRTFRTLKNMSESCTSSSEMLNNISNNKNNDFKFLNWTAKYKAMKSMDILGNFQSIRSLKTWLTSWKDHNINSKKNNSNVDSDFSDFYISDSDSRDSMKSYNNLLILTGPTGSGKTLSVYAVASELAIQVIEVNVSSKRTGKIILQDLHEATQSHKVNRGSENLRISLMPLGLKVGKMSHMKFKNDPIKSDNTTEHNTTCDQVISQFPTDGRPAMSLILIDDADIVFEQDDGFITSLTQIIQCSKRPVVIITTSLTCPHLQKFLHCNNIIKMSAFSPRMLGTWLDLMCFVERDEYWPNLGAELLKLYKGDIRKTINTLNFIIPNKFDIVYNDSESANLTVVENENSNMSSVVEECRIDQDNYEHLCRNNTLSEVFKYTACFVDSDKVSSGSAHFSFPVDILTLWWNLPNSLNLESVSKFNDKAKYSYWTLVDSISVSDIIYSKTSPQRKNDVTSPQWLSSETDNLVDEEIMTSYNSLVEIGNEISFTIINNTFYNAQPDFGSEHEGDIYPDLIPLDMDLQRKKDRIAAGYDVLNNSFGPSILLDRRALAMDYWSACRTICRIEKDKSHTNLKRNNRYCHYLKSLKVENADYIFDKLSESLSNNQPKDELQ